MQVKKYKKGGMSDKKFSKKLGRAARGIPKAERTIKPFKKVDLGTTDQMKYDHLLEDKKLDRKNIRLARRRKKKFKARLIDPRKRKTIGDKLRANRVIKQQKRVDKRRDEVLAGKGGTDKGREEYAKLMAEKEAIKDARKKKKA